MTPDRRRELLGAYGADPARWPSDEAPPNEKHMSDVTADDLGQGEGDAKRLDGLLNQYSVEPAPSSLRAEILAVPERAADVRDVARMGRDQARPARRLSGTLVGALKRAFPPLAGLALASMLGFMVGAADLLPTHDRTVSVDASGLVLGDNGLGNFDL